MILSRKCYIVVIQILNTLIRLKFQFVKSRKISDLCSKIYEKIAKLT